jgi:hypothetical protein
LQYIKMLSSVGDGQENIQTESRMHMEKLQGWPGSSRRRFEEPWNPDKT